MTKGVILALGVLCLGGCSKPKNETVTYVCATPMGIAQVDEANAKTSGGPHSGVLTISNEAGASLEIPLVQCVVVRQPK